MTAHDSNSVSDPEDGRGSRLSAASTSGRNSNSEIDHADGADSDGHEAIDRMRPSESKTWQKHQHRLPTRLGRCINAVFKWIEGPRPPRPFKISPLWPFSLPVFRRSKRRRRLGFFAILLSTALYIIAFVAVLVTATSKCQIEGLGTPMRLSCTDQLWPGESSCDVNGTACLPFSGTSYPFRCPALCSRVQLLEQYSVGNETLSYRSLVVGGPTNGSGDSPKNLYRGDSYICPAAIHAGIIPDSTGGIGIIDLLGEQDNFPAVSANGINSIGFAPSFPLSMTFKPAVQSPGAPSYACQDPSWIVLSFTILYNVIVTVLTQSTPVFYATTFASAFFCVGLAVDAPTSSDFLEVVSFAFQGVLPASFVAYVIYRVCVRRTLRGICGTLDQLVLWLGCFWVGALDNMTFDKIPLERLLPHDIARQPGALVAVIVIVAVLVAAAIGQAWAYRREGRLPRYLLVYLMLGLGIMIVAVIPDLNFRLHHYIIALLLLPGTAVQTRPSLIYQGLLVGLFVNGIARWGFASILQASGDLFQHGLTGATPQLRPLNISDTNIAFTWPNDAAAYDSLSILVNDVERFRGLQATDPHAFTWTRPQPNASVYFRFAYTRQQPMGGIGVGDYSHPATWLPNGTWIPMAPDNF